MYNENMSCFHTQELLKYRIKIKIACKMSKICLSEFLDFFIRKICNLKLGKLCLRVVVKLLKIFCKILTSEFFNLVIVTSEFFCLHPSSRSTH